MAQQSVKLRATELAESGTATRSRDMAHLKALVKRALIVNGMSPTRDQVNHDTIFVEHSKHECQQSNLYTADACSRFVRNRSSAERVGGPTRVGLDMVFSQPLQLSIFTARAHNKHTGNFRALVQRGAGGISRCSKSRDSAAGSSPSQTLTLVLICKPPPLSGCIRRLVLRLSCGRRFGLAPDQL